MVCPSFGVSVAIQEQKFSAMAWLPQEDWKLWRKVEFFETTRTIRGWSSPKGDYSKKIEVWTSNKGENKKYRIKKVKQNSRLKRRKWKRKRDVSQTRLFLLI